MEEVIMRKEGERGGRKEKGGGKGGRHHAAERRPAKALARATGEEALLTGTAVPTPCSQELRPRERLIAAALLLLMMMALSPASEQVLERNLGSPKRQVCA